MATSKPEGRGSTTLCERLAESSGEREGLSLPFCTLVTGRTHQIRVPLKAIHHPLVGDPVYGSPRWKGIADPALHDACRDFPRQALHARRLAFDHPVTGARVDAVAPVPADIAGLLVAAGLPLPDPAPNSRSQDGTTGPESRGVGYVSRNGTQSYTRKERIVKKLIRWVAMDVHAETIAVAAAESSREIRSLGVIRNRPDAVRQLVRSWGRSGS